MVLDYRGSKQGSSKIQRCYRRELKQLSEKHRTPVLKECLV